MSLSLNGIRFTGIKALALTDKNNQTTGKEINIPGNSELVISPEGEKVKLSIDPYKSYASVIIHQVDQGSKVVFNPSTEQIRLGIDPKKITPAKQSLLDGVESHKGTILAVNDYIHDNPELGLQEYKACDLLVKTLKEHGFEVKNPVAGLNTAFEAKFVNKREGGPVIGILAEYDALEGMGHGCGHNCIAASAIGAALTLSKNLGDTPATIKVYGTPAEETTGGKIDMAKAGLFNDCDVVLMSHPSDETTTGVPYLALQDFKITYKGQPAHAASPQDGISALDGALAFFNGINAYRQFAPEDAKLHGIIRHGGDASNVIPEKTVIEYTARANDTETLEKIIERVKQIAQAAALMSNTEVSVEMPPMYNNTVVLPTLASLLLKNAEVCGAQRISEPSGGGSTDFGNVSHIVPSECLDIAFVPQDTPGHTQTWVDAGISPEGHAAVLQASKAMALTAYDLINNPELLQQVKKDFQQAKK